MQTDWFDSAHHYLVNPPVVRIVDYSILKKFYSSSSDKKIVLQLFENLCKNMKCDGVEPIGFVVGGEFLRNNNNKDISFEYLAVFNNRYQIDEDSLFKYCNSGGEGVAIYNTKQKIMTPLGSITSIKGELDLKVLESNPKLKTMQTRTKLENSLHRVGVVAVNFQEVLSNDGN